MEFRKSLPAFKEKDQLLQAIARNQVSQHNEPFKSYLINGNYTIFFSFLLL